MFSYMDVQYDEPSVITDFCISGQLGEKREQPASFTCETKDFRPANQ